MNTRKRFRRNNQIGKVMILFALAMILTLVLDQFKVESQKTRLLQWFVLAASCIFAFLEFTVSFAIITPNYLDVRESIFFRKRILLKNIKKVSMIKSICVIILTRDHKRHKIFLKGLQNSEKLKFTRTLQRCAYNNNFTSGHHVHEVKEPKI